MENPAVNSHLERLLHFPGDGAIGVLNPFSRRAITANLKRISPRYLPFADAATAELPLSRLLRLSLFQVSVGMVVGLMVGTLNRVMIVEMQVAAWLVSLMVAVPLLFAPFRALVGFRSDTYRSALGWKRVPYIWFGTMLQFTGLAFMPFALILLSDPGRVPSWIGQVAAAAAFLVAGAGTHISQTAGLALATDLSTDQNRHRVVALMYVMLLVGMVFFSLLFGALLSSYSNYRLIQVVQGAALVALALNIGALWKQEARAKQQTHTNAPSKRFSEAWKAFSKESSLKRFLVVVGLGTAAFNMQDIILEPYGGEILGLGVAATTTLTALMAAGALAAFMLAAHLLSKGMDPLRLAALGPLTGAVAFALVIFSEPFQAPFLFRIGSILIGFGGGLFSVGSLCAAMQLDSKGFTGLALGAWGAVQATCGGIAIFLGGGLRDLVTGLATAGSLGPVLTGPGLGYSFVYHIELLLLFATLVALGPLVRSSSTPGTQPGSDFGLAEFPG
jgi:BCD family chlorophyll transporter-like MFS transporter